MTRNIKGPVLGGLRSELIGSAYAPSDEGYEETRTGWNLNARQSPALVVMAECAADVIAAVRLARDEGLGVGVMATGHGVAAPADGGVLINTSRMKDVRVDPETRTARVQAGAKWADVIPETAAHGLAGLGGSASGVGVVGYTTGGGFGWLGRKYGLAANSIKGADVITAGGELVRASAQESADLFWGLKGGGGNFGVVTSLELSLYPITRVYGGSLFYPVEKAEEGLELYSRWTYELPDEVTSSVAFVQPPPTPTIPEPIRGGSFVALRFCYTGENLKERGEEMLGPWRGELSEPVMDTLEVMPYGMLDAISSEPVDPVGVYDHTEMLRDLSPETRATLVEIAGAGSDSPLVELEVRHLGGALSRPSDDLSPMGRSDARFLLWGIGASSLETAGAAQAYFAHFSEALRAHVSGTQFVNFVDQNGATPERIRSAYSPEDWARLVEIKDLWDPGNLFRFNRNIPPTSATAAV